MRPRTLYFSSGQSFSHIVNMPMYGRYILILPIRSFLFSQRVPGRYSARSSTWLLSPFVRMYKSPPFCSWTIVTRCTIGISCPANLQTTTSPGINVSFQWVTRRVSPRQQPGSMLPVRTTTMGDYVLSDKPSIFQMDRADPTTIMRVKNCSSNYDGGSCYLFGLKGFEFLEGSQKEIHRCVCYYKQRSPNQRRMEQQIGEKFEKLCQECIFSTDKEVKRQAELSLNDFIINLNQSTLQAVLANQSQTAIFVVATLLVKNLHIHQNFRQLAELLAYSLVGWQVSPRTFIRFGQKIEVYVLNSVSHLLGEVLKRIYIEGSQGREWVMQMVDRWQNQSRLVLWTSLLRRVSEVDTGLGFLTYRNLSYNFQDQTMYRILNDVVPYFSRLTECVKLNELVSLQANLSVEEKNNKMPTSSLIFTTQELELAELVLELLQLILCFTYNITYSQYDMENMYQNTAISFPQKVKQNILKADFLESLFFLAERFALEQPRHNMLFTCLTCLQKVVLCRVTYDKKQTRRDFISKALKGVTKLMTIGGSIEYGRELGDINLKLLNNFSLRKFRKHEPFFSQWLQLNERYIMGLVEVRACTFDNEQFRQAMTLLSKIIGDSSNMKLKDYVLMIRGISSRIFEKVLVSFLSRNISILGDIPLRKMKHLLSMSDDVFQPMKTILCLNFQQECNFMFRLQTSILASFLESGAHGYCTANWLLFLTMLSHNDILGYNIYRESMLIHNLDMFQKLYPSAFQFITIYRQRPQLYHREVSMAILFLIERMLYQVMENLEVHQLNNKPSLSTSNRLYLAITGKLKESAVPIDQFIIDSFEIILSYMKSPDRLQVDYSLESLNKCLVKLKWSVRREAFKEMEMPKMIIDYCIQVARQNYLDPQSFGCRINLFKIITVAGFDDCLDNYRERLRYVFERMHLDSSHPNFLMLLYDLRGMAMQIDARPVYRLFLKKAIPTIKLLMNRLLMDDRNISADIIKQSLKMCRCFLQNKSQRLTLSVTAPLTYELVCLMLPLWLDILTKLNQLNQHNFENEMPLSTQLFRIFSEIMRGNYLNFYLLSSLQPAKTPAYLLQLMRHFSICYKEILKYPKTLQHYMLCCSFLARQLSELIFSEKGDELLVAFHNMVLLNYKICLLLLKELAGGITKNQKNLDRSFDTMVYALSYVRLALSLKHKANNVAQARYFVSANQPNASQMISSFLREAIRQFDSPHIFSELCRAIYSLMLLHPESIFQVNDSFRSLYVMEPKSQGIHEIQKRILQWKEYDSEVFVSLIKEWAGDVDEKAHANMMNAIERQEY